MDIDDASGTAACKIQSATDREILRVIGQHLISLGLKQTVDQLLAESGLAKLNHPSSHRLQQHILNGEWDKAETYMSELALYIDDRGSGFDEMRFLLNEQKFLELLDDGHRLEALNCLRNELTPLKPGIERLRQLSCLIMCSTPDDIRRRAKWEGKGTESRQKLVEKFQQFIPPSVMLPPRRLQTLLSQAVQLQRQRCPLHYQASDCNVTIDSADILSDHLCCRESFPCETVQILDDHQEEIWFCKFSNDGTKFASGARGGILIVYDVDPHTFRLSKCHTFKLDWFAICYFAWSPDDTHLLVCGHEDCHEVWICNVQTGELRLKVTHDKEDSLTTCAWHKDGDKFALGGMRGVMYLCDAEGNLIDRRHGLRVQCLAFKSDGKTLLAADKHCRVRAYSLDNLGAEEVPLIDETHSIMSFSCDKDERMIALSLQGQGIHLWDIQDRVLVRKYRGVVQGEFTVYSSFGGVNDKFLASGSEDCKVYIYHIDREKPVAILGGHKRCVNCVSWNPKYPELLASCSDDKTVRIWAPAAANDHHNHNHKSA